MVNLLFCEFFKLKRSKMFLISILGAMVAPIMVFAGLIKVKITEPEKVITYWEMLGQTNLYMLLLFGIIVYGVIAAYLFSREYSENTLKSILTVPVSKEAFLVAKFLMLFVWMLILTMVAWASTLGLSIVGNAAEFSGAVIMQSLKEYFLGVLLLYLTMSPFVFITLWQKNLVTPIISVATVVLGNVALANEDLAVLFPWSAPYLIASGVIKELSYSIEAALVIVFVVFFIGIVASFVYFKRQDVK
ncbi:ABC transporter permease [Gudongella sp. DL1XJH-153]|uniref:ABC transporter permease n=1 Tax=Gudongella sp. DL1XJH-153 TaxID=3409804 RepID=UPI003BB609F3